jgi:hypothetical protein
LPPALFPSFAFPSVTLFILPFLTTESLSQLDKKLPNTQFLFLRKFEARLTVYHLRSTGFSQREKSEKVSTRAGNSCSLAPNVGYSDVTHSQVCRQMRMSCDRRHRI